MEEEKEEWCYGKQTKNHGSDHRSSIEADFDIFNTSGIRDDLSAALQLCGYGDRRTVPGYGGIGGSGSHLVPSFPHIGFCPGGLCGIRYTGSSKFRGKGSGRDVPVFMERNMDLRDPQPGSVPGICTADRNSFADHEYPVGNFRHGRRIYRDFVLGNTGQCPL